MTHQQACLSQDALAARLRALLDDPRLPERARLRGDKLLRAATAPVRLLLTGLPGSGATTLANMLLGEQVLPSGRSLPPVHVAYGEELGAKIRLRNGDIEQLSGLDVSYIASQSPVFVELSAPYPVLKTMTILDVSLPKDPASAKAALAWAAARADMALWAGQGFGATEQALAAALPDQIRDHGYFVLTKADQLAASGTLQSAVPVLRQATSSIFRGFFAVSAEQGLAARRNDTPAGETAWHKSGGERLLATLIDRCRQGRQDDRDKAAHFADQYAIFAQSSTRATAEDPGEPAMPLEAPELGAIGAAVQRLSQLAADCSDGAANDDCDAVLAHCLVAAEELAEAIPDSNVRLRKLRDDAEQAYEMVTLFQLEANDDAAADAIGLLAQIRDELVFAEAA